MPEEQDYSLALLSAGNLPLEECVRLFKEGVLATGKKFAFNENDLAFYSLRQFYGLGLKTVLTEDLLIDADALQDLRGITSIDKYAGAIFYETFLAPLQLRKLKEKMIADPLQSPPFYSAIEGDSPRENYFQKVLVPHELTPRFTPSQLASIRKIEKEFKDKVCPHTRIDDCEQFLLSRYGYHRRILVPRDSMFHIE